MVELSFTCPHCRKPGTVEVQERRESFSVECGHCSKTFTLNVAPEHFQEFEQPVVQAQKTRPEGKRTSAEQDWAEHPIFILAFWAAVGLGIAWYNGVFTGGGRDEKVASENLVSDDETKEPPPEGQPNNSSSKDGNRPRQIATERLEELAIQHIKNQKGTWWNTDVEFDNNVLRFKSHTKFGYDILEQQLDRLNPNSVRLVWNGNDDYFVEYDILSGEKAIKKYLEVDRQGKSRHVWMESWGFIFTSRQKARECALILRDLISRKSGISVLSDELEYVDNVARFNLHTPSKPRSKYSVGDKVGAGTGLGYLLHGWRGTVVEANGKSYRIKITAKGDSPPYVIGKTYDFVESEIEGIVED